MTDTEEQNARKIQSWFRYHYRKKNPLHFVSNFNDRDLLSLEPIRELPVDKVFFLCSKTNSRVIACECEPWLGYFCSHYTYHPITKEMIDPESVWECYLKCKRFLGEDHQYMETCLSNKLRAQVVVDPSTYKKSMRITPTSPLVRILLDRIARTEKKNETKITFRLCDSRDSNVVFSKNYMSVFVTTDLPIQVTF